MAGGPLIDFYNIAHTGCVFIMLMLPDYTPLSVPY